MVLMSFPILQLASVASCLSNIMIVELSISCELSSCVHRIIASTSGLLALGTRSKPGGMYPADLVVRLRLTSSKAENSYRQGPAADMLTRSTGERHAARPA